MLSLQINFWVVKRKRDTCGWGVGEKEKSIFLLLTFKALNWKVFTITAYKDVIFMRLFRQSATNRYQSISIYLLIVIENQYQSITTIIFAINWSSIININQLEWVESRKSRKKIGNLKHAAKVEKENSCALWTTNSFTHLLNCETCKFVQTNHFVPPLCFCMCSQDLFCTKTCLVLFVKPFHSFKLKSVLYSYCLTERNSHVCAPPWFVSEELII